VTLSTWLVFCSVSLLTAFTPGPAVLLALSNAVSVGSRRALIGSIGNACGVFLVSAVAMAGLGVVLRTSALAFTLLKVAGAAYLIYLGIRQWRSHSSVLSQAPTAAAAAPVQHESRRLFGQGLTVAVTNPKSILFFSALFPQFLAGGTSLVQQYWVLTTTFAACTVLSHLSYLWLAGSMKRLLKSSARARAFNRACGGMFVALGLAMLRLPGKAA
jgi:homoserine/homoserine lactone efflux protein